MSKKNVNKVPEPKNKEWPVVVYMWSLGVGLLGYLVFGEAMFEGRPHPIHWLAGAIGAVVGIGVGWLWYRWRGDVI